MNTRLAYQMGYSIGMAKFAGDTPPAKPKPAEDRNIPMDMRQLADAYFRGLYNPPKRREGRGQLLETPTTVRPPRFVFSHKDVKTPYVNPENPKRQPMFMSPSGRILERLTGLDDLRTDEKVEQLIKDPRHRLQLLRPARQRIAAEERARLKASK